MYSYAYNKIILYIYIYIYIYWPRNGYPKTGNTNSWRKADTFGDFRESWHEKLTLSVMDDFDVFSTLHVLFETT